MQEDSNGGKIRTLDSVTAVPDIYTATSIAEIRASLDDLARREASVTERLQTLIASQNDVSRELGRLDLLRARLGTQVVNTRSISNGVLSKASSTASRISSAVKRLDLEQSRVQATLQVVEQVAELKACVLGVSGSMGAPQDWEMAAGYLNKASKIPHEVLTGSFAEEIVPTIEVPDPPAVTLRNAAESLCGLFLREFDKAMKDGDGAKITRFFKLFPLIGRTEVGLDAYGRYVCQGVASRAWQNLHAGTGGARSKEGLFYANALSKLFEHIAQIIDGHGSLVERHYGPGTMVRVMERLQAEADLQGGNIIDTWKDGRQLDRRLTDVKSYAFTFLVQSFLPQQRSTERAGSPTQRQSRSEDEEADMKEVDAILGEISVMLGRWALYSRFLATKSTADAEVPEQQSNERPSPQHLSMPAFLAESNLHRKITANLVEPCNTMSTFFFRRSIEKAFQIDEQPSGLTLHPSKPLGAQPPFITSVVDDVMYILAQVIQRCLATAQRSVIANVVPTVARMLGSDFVGMIQRKMRDDCYPKAAIQGTLPPEDKIISFLVSINNLDVANGYMQRIVDNHLHQRQQRQEPGKDPSTSFTTLQEDHLSDLLPFGDDAVAVRKALSTLETSFTAKTSELITDAISVTYYQIIKPRLRPILADAFRDVNYAPTGIDNVTASYGGAEHVDPDEISAETLENLVRDRFERGWDALTKPLKRILTDHNFDRLLTLSTSQLARALEKRIWSYYGRVNAIGAVRLERDVSGIVHAATKSGRYSLRDAFARCLQIVMVANMEDDEWEALGRSVDDSVGEDAEIEWVLDAPERERARGIVHGAR